MTDVIRYKRGEGAYVHKRNTEVPTDLVDEILLTIDNTEPLYERLKRIVKDSREHNNLNRLYRALKGLVKDGAAQMRANEGNSNKRSPSTKEAVHEVAAAALSKRIQAEVKAGEWDWLVA